MQRSHKDPTDHVTRLADIMARLRGPDGCPWDKEQTHRSLQKYLVEETGELCEAIDECDDKNILDELGDVLFQVIFHCRIAEEEGRFNLQTVAENCCLKMIRRHPHVFGESSAATTEEIRGQWENIKKSEERGKKADSAVSGIPRHLPALHRAQKIQKKAAATGFEWDCLGDALAKIREELDEVEQALQADSDEEVAEEIGDLLFAVVNLSRFRKHYAEQLLHDTVRKFETRFRCMEKLLQKSGRVPESSGLDELTRAWNQAKNEARGKDGARS